MKKLFTILFFGSVIGTINAQVNQGQIIYLEETKLEINLENSDMEHIKSMLPASRKKSMELLFNSSASIYKDYEHVNANDDHGDLHFTSEDGGMQVKIMTMRGENEFYKDLLENRTVEQREFMTKKFLIKDEIKNYDWKLTGENKTILGYVCQQAVWKDDSKEVTAWFAPQITVSSGPESFGKLPGLILEVNVDDGKKLITASEINLQEIDSKELHEPVKGKVVTREEFREIVTEKMKEMEDLGGGNRGFKYIQNH